MLDVLTAEDVIGNCHYGELDAVAQVRVRTEQNKLRRLLARGRDSAACALCGEEYPLEFLIAAHIKKRAACSGDERPMLACSFGCDKLYEEGWITVAADGTIRARPDDNRAGDRLKARPDQLHGRQCMAIHCTPNHISHGTGQRFSAETNRDDSAQRSLSSTKHLAEQIAATYEDQRSPPHAPAALGPSVNMLRLAEPAIRRVPWILCREDFGFGAVC